MHSRRFLLSLIMVVLVLPACRRTPDAPESASTAGPGSAAASPVDDTPLPTTGPGDASLTYEVVARDPTRYRGKRVTWVFVPCSAEYRRMMCALDMRAAMGPEHAGIYVVEFASADEAGRVFREAAFLPGCTVTGTVAGTAEQHLVVRGPDGQAKPDIPKVTVPLLLHPVYTVGSAGGKE